MTSSSPGGELAGKLGDALAGGFDKLFGDNKVTSALSESLGEAGLVGSILSSVLGILDLIAEKGISGIASGIVDTVLGAVDSLLEDILSLNIVKDIGSSVANGIGGILDTITFGGFGSINWNGSNAKEVEETIDRLTDRNEALQGSIDALNDTIKEGRGTQSVAAAKQAYEYQEEQNRNYLEIAQAQAGYHNSHHSWQYYMGWSQDWIDWIRQNIDETFSGTEDLWDWTPEQMKALQGNVEIWNAMRDAGEGGYGERVVEKLEDYIEQAGKLDEITEELNESLTQISFSTLYDSFIDTLMDMDASAEDAADSIAEYFMRAMLSNKIGDLYYDKLEAWWEKFGKAMEDNELTESERNALAEEYMGYVNEAMALRDEIAAATGYDRTASGSSSDNAIEGLEELQKAYDKLSETLEKTYSEDSVRILEQQNENLREQAELIRKRIAEEQKYTNPETDYISELEEDLEDINAQIEENKEAMKDAIFGSDIQSAISDFVTAYQDALGGGSSTQKMSKDFVEDMIKGMITESMKADASPVMENVREKLIEAWADGVVTAEEQMSIEGIINKLNRELADKYGWADSLFGESDIEGLEELQKAYDKLSDAVSEAYSTEKAGLLKQQYDLLQQQYDLILESIEAEKNLGTRADTSLIEEWEEELESVKEQIEENKEAQLDAIFGQETKTQISNLANALVDVWSGAESRATSAKDFINGIIKDMVTESLMADLTPFIESLREQMSEMMEDGIISSGESDILREMVEAIMEQLEEQYKWAEAFLEDVSETFSGMTFESMRDDFVSNLSDMEYSYSDMCDDFESMLKESIIRGFIESKYKSQIQKLIDTWDMYGESGNIDSGEIEDLREQYKELISAMIEDRDELAAQFGWSKSQQSASSKGFETMTQDQASELNGRFTAMYESDLRREAIQEAQLETLLSMSGSGTAYTGSRKTEGGNGISLDLGGLEDIAEETRTILANSYLELQQISENTGEIIKPIKQMQLDMAQVKINTGRL